MNFDPKTSVLRSQKVDA